MVPDDAQRPVPGAALPPSLSWAELSHHITVGDSAGLAPLVHIDGAAATPAESAMARTAPVLTYRASTQQPDPGVDLVLDGEHVEAAQATLARAPQSTITLALLLRMSERMPVADALQAESLAYATLQSGAEFARWLGERGPARPDRRAELARVRTGADGNTSTVTLTRRDRANSLDARARMELLEAFTALAHTDGPVLWQGDGPHFCAGADLSDFGRVASPAEAHMIRMRHNLPLAAARLGGRMTVRVHGACVGAGMELSSFAHRVVAHPDAFWRLPELAMGLLPGSGGTVSIPRRIGRQRTLWLAATATTLDASRALRWGLVDAVEA